MDVKFNQHQLISGLTDRAIEANMSLPIHVTGMDTENYSGLSDLLQSLSGHLNKDGVLKSTEKDVTQAEENLEKAKYSYLQQHVLHHELHEMMIDKEISQQERAADSQTEKFNDALRECVSTAEACSYLHPRSTGEGDQTATLLGLTEEDLLDANPNMKKIAVLQQHFIPQLEGRLQQKCEEVASCHYTSSTDSDQLSFAKATRLPDILKEECTKLAEEKENSRLDKAHITKQTWSLYHALTEALDILVELITKHRMNIQAEKDSVTTDLLGARCHATQLKMRVFRAQLHCDIYRPEAVAALKQIRSHLSRKIEDKESELSYLGQSLQSYQAIGMGFEELALEYEQLQKALTNKKWALTKLKQSMADETANDWEEG